MPQPWFASAPLFWIGRSSFSQSSELQGPEAPGGTDRLKDLNEVSNATSVHFSEVRQRDRVSSVWSENQNWLGEWGNGPILVVFTISTQSDLRQALEFFKQRSMDLSRRATEASVGPSEGRVWRDHGFAILEKPSDKVTQLLKNAGWAEVLTLPVLSKAWSHKLHMHAQMAYEPQARAKWGLGSHRESLPTEVKKNRTEDFKYDRGIAAFQSRKMEFTLIRKGELSLPHPFRFDFLERTERGFWMDGPLMGLEPGEQIAVRVDCNLQNLQESFELQARVLSAEHADRLREWVHLESDPSTPAEKQAWAKIDAEIEHKQKWVQWFFEEANGSV